MSKWKIGVIGAGKMAGCLVQSWVRSGMVEPSHVMASVPLHDQCLLDPLVRLGCQGTHDNMDIARFGDLVVLGVKPNVIPHVAKELKDKGTGDQLLVSLAAGVDMRSIEDYFGSGWLFARVMANTPVTVEEGTSVYCLGEGVKKEQGDLVEQLLSSVGLCVNVTEDKMDAVTGVSGSGPAYMYLVMEAMADEGVRQGLDRQLAYRLAAQTMVGAGKMVLSTGLHPGQLKDEVTSPGGSTIAAIRSLESAGVRGAIMGAVEAAVNRCRDMNGK